ncbi:SUN domain-containing protein 3-like isoform X2 [Rhodnius prolixus]|uniref:SUN domain-containing protein 3-like isoform X2 n=1 Tax=Rhodnius prolixus TaxID=13249 RepID=UPI003D18EC8E
MPIRTRRSSRMSSSKSEGCPTGPNISRDEEFTGNVRRRCIPVDCIPTCPTCQEHNYSFSIVKKSLKCFGIIFIIAYLASYLGSCFQSENYPYNDDIPSTAGAGQSSITAETNGEKKLELAGSIDKRIYDLEVQFNSLLNEVREIKEGMNYHRGGCILSVRNTKTYKEGVAQISILGVPIMSFATDPRAIIQASVVPGECWALGGDKGTVVMQLISQVLITHVSLEHISAKLSPTGDISSAPKEFVLKGLASIDDKVPHTYGTFMYSNSGPTLQTFTVQNPTPKPYEIVEFSVLSNHGNKEFTCIYRVRIHGKPAPKQDVKKKSSV